MSDQDPNRAHLYGLLVMTAIILLVSMQMAAAVTSGDLEEYSEDAAAYCEQELGENASVVNIHAIVGGGLHCQGPDGEMIHLHDVPREEIEAAGEVEE